MPASSKSLLRPNESLTAGPAHAAREALLILVVSDVCFYREGLAAALHTNGNTAVACDHGGIEADACGRAPDVALVDLGDAAFLATIELVRHVFPSTPIVGLTIDDGAAAVILAASYAVRAFVSRDQSLAELVATVHEASAGNAVCPPAIASVLFERVAERDLFDTPDSTLTPREKEIAALVARGLTNKEIAATLVIGPATVKNHVHNVLRKLRVNRRTEAAAILRQ